MGRSAQLQLDAPKAASCERSFVEHASGAKLDRVELTAALDFTRPGDTLVVWKLDRPARSMRQLIDTVQSSDWAASPQRSRKTAVS